MLMIVRASREFPRGNFKPVNLALSPRSIKAILPWDVPGDLEYLLLVESYASNGSMNVEKYYITNDECDFVVSQARR
jgi:hypothetical protein